VTYFFVPDMTGIDLADEDAKFMKYLAENGWEGEVGEEDDKNLIVNARHEEEGKGDEHAKGSLLLCDEFIMLFKFTSLDSAHFL
jgi:hypothetical protein